MNGWLDRFRRWGNIPTNKGIEDEILANTDRLPGDWFSPPYRCTAIRGATDSANAVVTIERYWQLSELQDWHRHPASETSIKQERRMAKEDKDRIEESILDNLKELVLPYLEKLKKIEKNAQKRVYLDIIESNLYSIVEPFTKKLSSKFISLTPAELKVADLIKHGKSTKEIAQIFNLSQKTVETHRAIIRKKLRLTHTKANLRTYLLSLSCTRN